jgi:hypothetical protein
MNEYINCEDRQIKDKKAKELPLFLAMIYFQLKYLEILEYIKKDINKFICPNVEN